MSWQLNYSAEADERERKPSPVRTPTAQQGMEEKLDSYEVGPFCYTIVRQKGQDLPIFSATLGKPPNSDFLKRLEKFLTFLSQSTHTFPRKGFLTLQEVLDKVREFEAEESWGQNDRVLGIKTPIVGGSWGQVLLWAHITQLWKLMPFLVDPALEEIYVNAPSGRVILDHQRWGRLNTQTNLSKEECFNLLHRVAMENMEELNQLQPSVRGDLRVEDLFYVRVTGDIPPYALDGPSLNIRKLRTRPFSMTQLVLNQTLDSTTAAFLIFLVQHGTSVTIVGPPSGGKTTLQLALLQELPKYFRVLSLEQTVESNITLPHLTRYKTTKYLQNQANANQSMIVSKFLHRSPDFVNLGEVTTAEEALAWVACLSTGIPVTQTLHGTSIEAIIPRLTDVFKVSKTLLAGSRPHVVVEVRHVWHGQRKVRKVTGLAEFRLDTDQNLILDPILTSLPSLTGRNYLWTCNPVDSASVQQMQNYQHIDTQRELETIQLRLGTRKKSP